MPVISCRFPMSRKAASSVVSSGSTTTRPPGSSARNSGSRVDRCAVSTTDSPRSSTARAVCDPMEPRPPVMRIMIATLGRCRLPLLYETAVHGPEHRGVRRGVVVPAGARGPGLREELAGRHPQRACGTHGSGAPGRGSPPRRPTARDRRRRGPAGRSTPGRGRRRPGNARCGAAPSVRRRPRPGTGAAAAVRRSTATRAARLVRRATASGCGRPRSPADPVRLSTPRRRTGAGRARPAAWRRNPAGRSGGRCHATGRSPRSPGRPARPRAHR